MSSRSSSLTRVDGILVFSIIISCVSVSGAGQGAGSALARAVGSVLFITFDFYFVWALIVVLYKFKLSLQLDKNTSNTSSMFYITRYEFSIIEVSGCERLSSMGPQKKTRTFSSSYVLDSRPRELACCKPMYPMG
jgi:hypothetical protein